MSHWRQNATIWLVDKDKRPVVVGRCGFARWRGGRVFMFAFQEQSDRLLAAYQRHEREEGTSLPVSACPLSSVLRFVRTGLWPT